MKNIGLSIEYSEGKSTILNIPDTKIYTAGEILCVRSMLLMHLTGMAICAPDGTGMDVSGII